MSDIDLLAELKKSYEEIAKLRSDVAELRELLSYYLNHPVFQKGEFSFEPKNPCCVCKTGHMIAGDCFCSCHPQVTSV